ncbi:hypothetical protein [Halopseudomonas sabulinigri]|uniref:Uncharacterized protein n=1 Tax=Halopseudomonas sabulinigri TaxID=472181 RepID=A0ABP9ZL02_9GAMM
MSILAMYEAGQWHCPARVLTHLEDITAVLIEREVRLLQLPTELPEDRGQLQAAAAQRIADSGLPVPGCATAAELKGEPGYAEVPSRLDAGAVQRSAGQWLLLSAGQARLCLGLADQALVLAVRHGDLVWIPPGHEWALVPAAGSACHWLNLAGDEQALNDTPVPGSKLGELQLLDI